MTLEPDYRFTLANERTFLAWIRTAMALLAASIVIGDLFPRAAHSRDLMLLAVGCTVTSAVLALSAWNRWRQVQNAMRHGDPLPPPRLIMRLTVVIVCTGAVVCTAIVIR